MSLSVHVSYQAKLKAAEHVSKLLDEFRVFPILLLLSGGSSLGLLDLIKLPDRVGLTIGLTDDRFSTDPKISNWLQLQNQTDFCSRANGINATWFSTLPEENESLDSVAARYESALKTWRKNNPTGKIVATVGIGPDGHVIGILPFPEDPIYFHQTLVVTDRWVVGYDVGTKSPYQERITLTAPFLSQIDSAVIYAVGEQKKVALQSVIENKADPAVVPAILIHHIKSVDLFTDQLDMPSPTHLD